MRGTEFNSCLAALTPHLQLALDIFILVLHLLMPVLIAAVDCPVLLHPFAILNLNEFLDVGGQHELRLLGCDRLQTLDHEHIDATSAGIFNVVLSCVFIEGLAGFQALLGGQTHFDGLFLDGGQVIIEGDAAAAAAANADMLIAWIEWLTNRVVIRHTPVRLRHVEIAWPLRRGVGRPRSLIHRPVIEGMVGQESVQSGYFVGVLPEIVQVSDGVGAQPSVPLPLVLLIALLSALGHARLVDLEGLARLVSIHVTQTILRDDASLDSELGFRGGRHHNIQRR